MKQNRSFGHHEDYYDLNNVVNFNTCKWSPKEGLEQSYVKICKQMPLQAYLSKIKRNPSFVQSCKKTTLHKNSKSAKFSLET